MKNQDTKTIMQSAQAAILMLTMLLCAMSVRASESAVARWVFSTGYDVEKSGTTSIFTPNTLGWSQIANT